MGPSVPVLLMCLMVWSCARLVGCESAEQICEGLESCCNISTLEVYGGYSQSLVLPLNADWQKLVKKWDPEMETWKEEMMPAFGKTESLTSKTTSISLFGRNFTVWNAEKAEGGLYKIERYLDNRCLVVVNVTVLDPPLPLAVTPSSDVSSSVTSKVTEPPEASPPGTDHTAVCVTVAVLVCILIATGVIIQKLIKKKSKCRPNEATSEVDPERLLVDGGALADSPPGPPGGEAALQPKEGVSRFITPPGTR